MLAAFLLTALRVHWLRKRRFEIDDFALRRYSGRDVATLTFDHIRELSLHSREDETAAFLTMKDGRHYLIDQCQAYTSETGETLVHALLARLPPMAPPK